MGTDLKTFIVLVCVEDGEVTPYVNNLAEWHDVSSRDAYARMRKRISLSRESQAVLIGFETPAGEFEVHSERGRGMVDLCEKYPSIYRLEDSRTLYRFGRGSELLLFRMQWNWL
jgi:hypothetical protein